MTPFSRFAVPICLVATLLVPASLRAQVDVATNRYDGRRSGANLKETTLTPSNVNANDFGKLYSYPVDGAVYAQPLYLSAVSINGVPRNVLYIVTMNDKVYAFDADSTSPTPLWKVDLTSPSAVPVPVKDIVGTSQGNIVGNVGIESTPVIDRKPDGTGTLYLVARTKESGAYVQRLHALDIATGLPVSGSPVTITASVPGNAQDSTATPSGRMITFNPKMENQRAALALTHGVVLVSWSSHEDLKPYHGWVMGYDAATLRQVGAFAVTPDFDGGGIWQGGRAPTIDDNGDAYFATGNGTFDGQHNLGDSLLRFTVDATGMSVHSFFTPSNELFLNTNDKDLSGSSFTLLPGTPSLLLGGGKEGVLYLLAPDNLGGKTSDDSQVVQHIYVNGGHVMGGPVYWDSATSGPLVYNWSEDDVLIAYRLTGGVLTTPYAKGTVKSPGHPGGSLTISANGSAANSGVVWASMPTSQNAKIGLHAGILRAYNAETLAEIWTSEQNPARDRAGTLMKFVPPLVAAGRVFMPNQDNAVSVYGLLPPDFSVAVTPASTAIAPGGSAQLSVAVAAQGGFAGRVDLSAAGAPSGMDVTFSPASITGAGVATMTVAVASTVPTGTFNLAVTGTGATGVHTVNPIVVNVTPNPKADLSEIVMWAERAAIKAGTWHLVADTTAAGGLRLEQPDAGAPKVSPALTAPLHYVELTFDAEAGRAYRLWMRGRAQNDNYNNDSVWVQFDKSVDAAGAAANRIGTTQATAVIIEDCSGCGLSGWGWADNGYGTVGPPIYFSTTGPQTMRIQAREDGISIDQIVLSASKYLTASPGAAKNDTIILNEAPSLSSSGDVILYASEAPIIAGAWRVVTPDSSAANNARIEHPDAGAPKLPAPLASPVNYFEMTFQADAGRAYHFWLRGRAANNSWANDSVFVQFDDSVDASGAAKYRIDTTDAGIVTLEDCINCGVSGWGWQDNGFGAGVLGENIRFASSGTHRIRIQTREDGFSIDQIVLSPSTYLTTPPGGLENDATILQR
jgi:PQQ-like domain